jgi:hypothetical protein
MTVPWPSHVLRDRPGTYSEAKLGKLGLNALLPPEWILSRHTADQFPKLQRNANAQNRRSASRTLGRF